VTVDFAMKRAPKYRVASVRWVGPYQEGRVQSEWERLAKWANAKGLRTGKWFFSENGEGPRYKFEVAIEVKGPFKGDRKVRVRTFPASPIASVTFNPDQVSPRVLYHGLNDWLRWRKKDKTIKRARTWREVYTGNPWKDAKAWAHTEIQVLVSK
jgi:DNA gyrase inhibitor GyrI